MSHSSQSHTAPYNTLLSSFALTHKRSTTTHNMQFVLPPSLPETGRLAVHVDALRDALTPGCTDPLILARRLRARLPSAGIKVPTQYSDSLRRDVSTCEDVAALLITIAKYSEIEPDTVAKRVLKTSASRRRSTNTTTTAISRSTSDTDMKSANPRPRVKRSNTAPISSTGSRRRSSLQNSTVPKRPTAITPIKTRVVKTSPVSTISAVTKSVSPVSSSSVVSKKSVANNNYKKPTSRIITDKSESVQSKRASGKQSNIKRVSSPSGKARTTLTSTTSSRGTGKPAVVDNSKTVKSTSKQGIKAMAVVDKSEIDKNTSTTSLSKMASRTNPSKSTASTNVTNPSVSTASKTANSVAMSRIGNARGVARKSRSEHAIRPSKISAEPNGVVAKRIARSKSNVSAPTLPVARRLFNSEDSNSVNNTPRKKSSISRFTSVATTTTAVEMSPVTPARNDGDLDELVRNLEELFGGRRAVNRTSKTARMIRRYLKVAGYNVNRAQDQRLVLATSSCTDLKMFLVELANMVDSTAVVVARNIIEAKKKEDETPKRLGRLTALVTPTKLRKTPFVSKIETSDAKDDEAAKMLSPMKSEGSDESVTESRGGEEVVTTHAKSEKVELERSPPPMPVKKIEREKKILAKSEEKTTLPAKSKLPMRNRVWKEVVSTNGVEEYEQQMSDIRRLIVKARKLGVSKSRSGRSTWELRRRLAELEYQQKHAVSWPTVICMTSVLAYAALFQFVIFRQ